MRDSDIFLIQGPPGTGKTHTVHGIISMLAEANRKVMVCAPSNSAIDEIVLRLSTNKFGEIPRFVRVGAMNY
jgi:superfamily I DNA and/or RNA helicase